MCDPGIGIGLLAKGDGDLSLAVDEASPKRAHSQTLYDSARGPFLTGMAVLALFFGGAVAAISGERLASEVEGEESAHEFPVSLDELSEELRLAAGMAVTVIVATTPRTALQYPIASLSEAIARSMRGE